MAYFDTIVTNEQPPQISPWRLLFALLYAVCSDLIRSFSAAISAFICVISSASFSPHSSLVLAYTFFGVRFPYAFVGEYLPSNKWSLISVIHPVPGRRNFGCFGSNFAVCGVFTAWLGVCLSSLKLPSFRPKPCSILLAALRCILSVIWVYIFKVVSDEM